MIKLKSLQSAFGVSDPLMHVIGNIEIHFSDIWYDNHYVELAKLQVFLLICLILSRKDNMSDQHSFCLWYFLEMLKPNFLVWLNCHLHKIEDSPFPQHFFSLSRNSYASLSIILFCYDLLGLFLCPLRCNVLNREIKISVCMSLI